MTVIDYITDKFPEFVGVLGIFLCLLECIVEDDSQLRRKAGWIYRLFRDKSILDIPSRLIAKFQSRLYLVNWSSEASTFLKMIKLSAGLILIPLHTYRTLPHPFPTWEFAAIPLGFYGIALILIFGFLRSTRRFLEEKTNSVDILTFGGFLWLANNVLMLNVNFLLSPKEPLLTEPFQEANALLYLDQLIGTERAISCFMALAVGSAYLMASFVASTVFRYLLSDLVAAGAARHVAIFTAVMGLASMALYDFNPNIGFPAPLSLYLPCVLLVGSMSAVITTIVTHMERRILTSTLGLIVLPVAGFFTTGKIIPIFEDMSTPIFMIVFSPMLFTYLLALLFGLVATSLQASKKIFGSDKAYGTPFGTLGTFICFLASLLTLFPG